MVTDLNEAQFNDFVKQSGIVMVDCGAPWCGPCRRMGPVVDEIGADLAGKVAVGKLNTDENQHVAMQFGIMNIPTLVFVKNGELVDRHVGVIKKEELVAKINQHL